MTKVTYGISPECLCHDVRDNVKRVGALEEAGFEYIWEGDHTLPWQHSSGHSSGIYSTLSAFLQNTERATVGAMVIPPLGLRQHPIDVALEVATQALLHPGRVALCVGTGEAMNEKTTTGVWPSTRERIERTVEAMELIKQAWTSDEFFTFKGKHFKSFFHMYTKPEQDIPLLCASNGPMMAGNAGRHSDGYVSVGVPPSHHTDVVRPAFDAGAREAGKDPAELMRCAWVSTSYHPSREKALEGARVYGGLLIPECYHYIQDPRVIEERALLVRDEALLDAFCVATSAEEVAERFDAFIEVGCNHIIWADMSPDPFLVADCAAEALAMLREKHAAPAAS